LIEPFAGSAAVSLLAAQQGTALSFWLNDLNTPLIELWRAIIGTPEVLANEYGRLWEGQLGQEREYYDLVRDSFNRTHQTHALLYLLARCVKASVRYNTQGEFNQSPDNRRKGKHPTSMRQEILRASALLAGRTRLTSLDYKDVLAQANADDFVYLDPPYQGVTKRDRRYLESVGVAELVRQLEQLNRREIAYLLSYDGQTGAKSFGQPLPDNLRLLRLEIAAGRSSQATLLGRSDHTIEAVYLSPALVKKLNLQVHSCVPKQLPLFVEPA